MDVSYYKEKYEPIDGKWYITKELGRGAFGTVFEIERRDFSHAKSALKVITIPASQSEIQSYCDENFDSDEKSVTSYFYGFVEEFINEFKLMAKLKGNSNIVSIEDYDVKKHEEDIGWDILIRVELLTPMNRHFKENKLNQQTVIKLGIDICKALETCQKFKIIHRDIKPSNIFVSETGDFKLGDFGVARTLEKTSSGLSKKGTSTYMAPEVFKGEEYGSNVDIYSLGLVMYRLLNNNFEPFRTERTHSDEENALTRRLKGESIPKPANADGRLAKIILKACSFNPKERYESPLQMRHELESILYSEHDVSFMHTGGDEIEYNDTDGEISDNTRGIFSNCEETNGAESEFETVIDDKTVEIFDISKNDSINDDESDEKQIENEIVDKFTKQNKSSKTTVGIVAGIIALIGIIKKPSKDEKKTLEETNKADDHPSKSYIKWIAIFAIFVVSLTVIVALLYNSSKDKMTENRIQLSDINVLDVVSIGSYEQDNNIENGNERIEWVVLDKSEDEVLLVSKNILDVQQYNGVPGEVTWENSSLKKWLNKEFYNYAFSYDEQSIVVGNNSENVTLLNIDEVREYQGIIDSNLDEFTNFSYDKTYKIMSRPDNEGFIAPYGEKMHRQVYSGWWIKSSKPLDYAMTYGFFDDEVMENSGMKVTANFIGVRPVIRIKNALKTEDGNVVLESLIKSKSDTKEYLKNKKIRFDDTRLSEYTIFEYDENGRETKMTSYDKYENTILYYAIIEYDKNDNMIKWLDYDENNIKYSETKFIYNEDRLVKEIIFDENGQQTATIEYTYEGCNRIQKWIDKDGNVDMKSGFIEELDINGNRVKSFSYENGEVDEFTKFFYGQHGEYIGSEHYNSDWLLENKETCTFIE